MAAQEPTAPEIFEPLVKAGEVELQRGPKDLALSGFIAGPDIGFGPLAMAVVAGRLHEAFHLAMAQAQTTVPTVLLQPLRRAHHGCLCSVQADLPRDGHTAGEP